MTSQIFREPSSGILCFGSNRDKIFLLSYLKIRIRKDLDSMEPISGANKVDQNMGVPHNRLSKETPYHVHPDACFFLPKSFCVYILPSQLCYSLHENHNHVLGLYAVHTTHNTAWWMDWNRSPTCHIIYQLPYSFQNYKQSNMNITRYINDGEGGFVLKWKDDMQL